jgi:hypothetical protein
MIGVMVPSVSAEINLNSLFPTSTQTRDEQGVNAMRVWDCEIWQPDMSICFIHPINNNAQETLGKSYSSGINLVLTKWDSNSLASQNYYQSDYQIKVKPIFDNNLIGADCHSLQFTHYPELPIRIECIKENITMNFYDSGDSGGAGGTMPKMEMKKYSLDLFQILSKNYNYAYEQEKIDEQEESKIVQLELEQKSTSDYSLSESNDLEKYVKFGVSGWALSKSESESFTYGISNVQGHEVRYASIGSGAMLLKIQEFPTPELASEYNTMKIIEKINESKYVFEEVVWKNSPNGCSMFVEYKGLDFPTAYCVIDNFRIYTTSLGLIGDSQLYPFVEKTINKIHQYNVQDTVVVTQESSEEGGGCLIATATYGSELSPQIQQLRELRDNQLLQTSSGTVFMSTFNNVYYSFSPIIADMERQSPMFKEIVKIAITPMISSLSLMENAESESEVLSIGISVIVLNLGIYLAVPAIVVIGIRKRF